MYKKILISFFIIFLFSPTILASSNDQNKTNKEIFVEEDFNNDE